MGCIKEIPTLKGDNYTEWKKKINLAFILAEMDWVVTSPWPTEPVAPVRETNEADAAWVKGPCVVLVIEWQLRWTNCVYVRYTGD